MCSINHINKNHNKFLCQDRIEIDILPSRLRQEKMYKSLINDSVKTFMQHCQTSKYGTKYQVNKQQH